MNKWQEQNHFFHATWTSEKNLRTRVECVTHVSLSALTIPFAIGMDWFPFRFVFTQFSLCVHFPTDASVCFPTQLPYSSCTFNFLSISLTHSLSVSLFLLHIFHFHFFTYSSCVSSNRWQSSFFPYSFLQQLPQIHHCFLIPGNGVHEDIYLNEQIISSAHCIHTYTPNSIMNRAEFATHRKKIIFYVKN